MRKSIIIDTDYYKNTHDKMYDPAVKKIFSYAESRGGTYNESIFFGLQHYIKDSLMNPITNEDIEYGEYIISGMGGKPFDKAPWKLLQDKYGGYAPVTIKAVKEGLRMPVKNLLVSVENTDDDFRWIVGHIETSLIRLWYPTTIATKAFHIRKNIEELYKIYADSKASADFAFLDFGCRGVETFESAAVGGASFLTSFIGTDTVPGVVLVDQHYGGGIKGFSVDATEHSVMCSYGRENERASFERLIDITQEGQILSVVCDTWNIYEACKMWVSLKDKIEAKKLQLVIRPDSGKPEEVLDKMLDILGEGFSYHINDKGYRVFDYIKLLWGDGVNEDNFESILMTMPNAGFGVENLMLGSGGGLLQNVNRDTMKFAFKASAVEKNNSWVNIFKDPITDPGKKSKAGRLATIRSKETGEITTVHESLAKQLGPPLLEKVYENGKLLRDQSFDDIRKLVRE